MADEIVDDRSHWPTPEIPPSPVSAKTHGPAINWTPEQWALSTSGRRVSKTTDLNAAKT